MTFVPENQKHNSEILSKEDFAIVDNEVIVRDFRSFWRSDEANVEVTVLIDASESIKARYAQEISDLLHLLLEARWTSEEQLSVMSFSGLQAKVLCAGTCRSWIVGDPLKILPVGGTTPLFDAVEFASRSLAKRRDPESQPVLILFSDGDDTISRNSSDDAIGAALRSDVQIYTVDIGKPGVEDAGAANLRAMAAATGGRSLTIRDGSAKILAAVIDDLQSEYVVSYSAPTRKQGFHPVHILSTRNSNMQFRSRRGYYYQGNTAQ